MARCQPREHAPNVEVVEVKCAAGQAACVDAVALGTGDLTAAVDRTLHYVGWLELDDREQVLAAAFA